MQLHQYVALLLGVGLITIILVMLVGWLVLENQRKYAAFQRVRYENMLRYRLTDFSNQVTADLSAMFLRYLLSPRVGGTERVSVEAIAGTVQGMLQAIAAHHNHEFKSSEVGDTLLGLLIKEVSYETQSDRIIFTLTRPGATNLTYTLTHPEAYGSMLCCELEDYRMRLRDRATLQIKREFDQVPQTYKAAFPNSERINTTA
ncbi:hypothetical protein SIMMY50_82 [Erwinia phage vB_EamM_Simmy50]|uniref:Uncharacterized protein n=1 Tax=Erwinia phage vB_EamM_Simmy50 TaxID=1815988 RepID=A0A173GCY7_9CAUD|nr:hypothetical protein FDH99_gp082 [Erwinia phage vB_EamM_Simmy50]ANH51544.1 hypothetical protein SIMMY50_82 [Erwinia phage vB_EamM_Simmy50]